MVAIDTFNEAVARTKEDYEAKDEWSPDEDRESDRYRQEAAELLGIPEVVGDIDNATQ